MTVSSVLAGEPNLPLPVAHSTGGRRLQPAFFRGLSRKERGELRRAGVVRRVPAGHLFYHAQDEVSETIYVLLDGCVHLYRISPSGKKLIVVLLGPGALFDEASLIGAEVHNNYAEAADHSRVLAIGRTELVALMMRRPTVLLRVLEMTCSRLHLVERKLESLAFADMTTRLAEVLLQLAREQGSCEVTGFTHQDLAEIVGTHRETATSVLNNLQAQGTIAIRRKHIHILDPIRLSARI